jgi:hypothetical protein
MRPQTKRPWSFQRWTMSLSGKNVPRWKLINGFYVPSIFCPWTLHPSQYSHFLGTLWPSLMFQTLIITFGHFVFIRNTYGFLWRKTSSKFKYFTYFIAEMFACKILPYNTQKVGKPNRFLKVWCHEIINPFAPMQLTTVTLFCQIFTVLEYSPISVKFRLPHLAPCTL